MKFSIRHLLRLTLVVALVVGATVHPSTSPPEDSGVNPNPGIRNALWVSQNETETSEIERNSIPLFELDGDWDFYRVDPTKLADR